MKLSVRTLVSASFARSPGVSTFNESTLASLGHESDAGRIKLPSALSGTVQRRGHVQL